MLITEIRQRDTDGDGAFDRETRTESTFQDGKLAFQIEWKGSSGAGYAGYEGYSSVEYTYNVLGQEVFRELQFDPELGGIPDVSHVHTSYDERGFNVGEVWQHLEWGTDEVGSQTVKQFEWRDDGQPLRLREDYYDGGSETSIEYRDETWTYNTSGQVASWKVDDPGFFDCDVTTFYTYRYGKLANIKLQDEIRFGDDRPRTTESFSYKADGSLKESTLWGTWTEYGWSPWTQTQYTTNADFYEKETKLIDLTGDFKFEFKEVTELWKVARVDPGPEDPSQLLVSSYDAAGNLLNQDLTTWTYNEHGVETMTIDYGNDSIIEEYLVRTVEADLMVA